MLKLKGLDHVGLRVTDLDRSIEFYQRLGMKLLRSRGPDAAGERFAVIQAGDQELNLVARPGATPSADKEALGMNHFCILVDYETIEAVVDGLKAAGIEIASGPSPRRDGAAVLVRDPDGVAVELQIKGRPAR